MRARDRRRSRPQREHDPSRVGSPSRAAHSECSKDAKRKVQSMMEQGGAVSSVVGAIGASRFLTGVASVLGAQATAASAAPSGPAEVRV